MKRHYAFKTEHPDPIEKAAWAAYEKKRDRILQEARDKGWRRWQGPFFFHLEKKLRSIGCLCPEMWTDDLRQERLDELQYESRHKDA